MHNKIKGRAVLYWNTGVTTAPLILGLGAPACTTLVSIEPEEVGCDISFPRFERCG